MLNIIIRNIKEEDIPQVVDIQIEGWKAAYKHIIDNEYLETMDREQRINKRRKNYKESSFIVAESNNEIVGFCRYSDKVISNDGEDYDSEIMAIYVKPSLKHQGIGKKMFEYVKEDLKRQGKKSTILWCLKENYSSRKFYEKMGGKIVGEHGIDIGEKTYPEVGFGFTF